MTVFFYISNIFYYVFQRTGVLSSFSGLVVYSNGPNQFWLQLDDEYDAVMEIGATLADHCASSNNCPLGNPKPGQVCAALYHEDNTWYRATVKKIEAEKVQVGSGSSSNS